MKVTGVVTHFRNGNVNASQWSWFISTTFCTKAQQEGNCDNCQKACLHQWKVRYLKATWAFSYSNEFLWQDWCGHYLWMGRIQSQKCVQIFLYIFWCWLYNCPIYLTYQVITSKFNWIRIQFYFPSFLTRAKMKLSIWSKVSWK